MGNNPFARDTLEGPFNGVLGGPNTASPGYESVAGILSHLMGPDTWNAMSPVAQQALVRIVTAPQAEDPVGMAQDAFQQRNNPVPTPMPTSAPTPQPVSTPESRILPFLRR